MPLTSNELHIHVIVRGAFPDTSPSGTEADGVIHDNGREAPVIPLVPGDISQPREELPIRFYHCHRPYYEFTNFANYSVRYEGRRYPTGEHLFQALKFMETDSRLAERVRRMPTPREALREATRLRNRQRTDWFEVNVGFMDQILQAKFSQHPHLERLLLDTGSRELIEDSPVDSFWGIGANGRGQNELGKALMRLRDELRANVGIIHRGTASRLT